MNTKFEGPFVSAFETDPVGVIKQNLLHIVLKAVCCVKKQQHVNLIWIKLTGTIHNQLNL
jgi:hypothetical protein